MNKVNSICEYLIRLVNNCQLESKWKDMRLMSLGERFRTACEHVKMTQADAARELGISQPTLSRMLRPTGDKLLYQYLDAFLALHPIISRQWMWLGEGEMLANSPEKRPKTRQRENIHDCELVEKQLADTRLELSETQRKLIAAQETIISLQSRQVREYQGENQTGGFASTPVPGARAGCPFNEGGRK